MFDIVCYDLAGYGMFKVGMRARGQRRARTHTSSGAVRHGVEMAGRKPLIVTISHRARKFGGQTMRKGMVGRDFFRRVLVPGILTTSLTVIPAKAGIQCLSTRRTEGAGFRLSPE
ncbi:hypothetical protein [Dyella japonica]|uniref:Uncharacterized protein n=1 Tax=Dyella japonica TaxID=231455 RepID=A0ABV2JXS5_9GAMM